MAPKKKLVEIEDVDDLFSLFATDVSNEPEPVHQDSAVDEILAELDVAPVPTEPEVLEIPQPEVVEEPPVEPVLVVVENEPAVVPVGLTEMPPPRPPYIKDRVRSPMGLDCGHTNFKMPAKAMEAARKKGFCCPAQIPSSAADVYSTGIPVNWRDLNGAYLRPVPVYQRRALDALRKPSRQGLCCDDDGWYIGGLTNHCVSDRPEGAPLCTAHRPQIEPVVVEPIPVFTTPSEGKAEPIQPKKTAKQRQMEARKKKG